MSLPALGMGGMGTKYMNGYAMGGYVMPGYAKGGMVQSGDINYNYEINVDVSGSNASPQDIAQEVLRVIKLRDTMSRTVTRV